MGGIIIKNQPSIPFEKSKEEIVKLVLPVYYTEEAITPRDQQLIHSSWNMVTGDSAPEYLEERKRPNFPHETCLSYFCYLFYSRLFQIHPEAKPLFEHAISLQEMKHGKVVLKMIAVFIKAMENDPEHLQMLVKLAEQHYSRGIKAVQCKISSRCYFISLIILFINCYFLLMQTVSLEK